ncbi:hypothetical protein ACSBR1_006225 [Camellia fascicularis]
MGEKDMDVSTDPSPISPPTSSEAMADVGSPTREAPLVTPKVKSFRYASATPKNQDFYFDEAANTLLSDDDADDDRDSTIQEGVAANDPNDIPRIALPKKLLQQIRQPWTNTLIVRLLGKSIRYRLLCAKVKNLWTLQEEFTAIDLGNNYFLFKFSSREDCDHVYMGGPWVIMDHYLIIRKWEPDFKALDTFETSTAVWVRFPELSI